MNSACHLFNFVYFEDFQEILAIMCPFTWSASAFDSISLDTLSAAWETYVSQMF